MRLRSSDGAQVELRPMRYQFAGFKGDGSDRDWDANWLIIRGEVRTADGRSWSFEDPCLTTWDAQELGAWLRGVVSGAVQPTPFNGGEDDRIKEFLEPNVAMSLAARDNAEAAIRVHLSLEAQPPWLSGADPVELFEFYVEVTASLQAIAEAAGAWEQELAVFPRR